MIWSKHPERQGEPRDGRPLTNAEFARLAGFNAQETENSTEDVMSFIRAHAAAPEGSEHFTANVLRHWRAQQLKRGLAYWSPAIVAASIAALAVLAVLQMLNAPIGQPDLTNHEASRVAPRSIVFPDPNLSSSTSVR